MFRWLDVPLVKGSHVSVQYFLPLAGAQRADFSWLAKALSERLIVARYEDIRDVPDGLT